MRGRQRGTRRLHLTLRLIGFSRAQPLPCCSEDSSLETPLHPALSDPVVDCHLFGTHQCTFCGHRETDIFKLNHTRPLC